MDFCRFALLTNPPFAPLRIPMSQRKKDRIVRPRKLKPDSKPKKPDLMPSWLKTDQALAAGQRFFRPVDWLAFAITLLISLIGYCLTISPDLTLEDSGELAVASMYAGVPHPPGYPVWTIYTWIFTKLVPISNIAFRVALSSAIAAAFSSGLLALLTSRASSRIVESIEWFNGIETELVNRLALVSGCVAGLMLAFSGFMWSQAVIVEVYTLSVLSLMGVLCCLYRWTQDTKRTRYLYWSFFWFGICLCNHQTLIVAAMGIETVILFAHPRLGRNFFTVNSLVYLLILVLMGIGAIELFVDNVPMQVMFHLLGVSFLIVTGFLWFATLAQNQGRRDVTIVEELKDGLKVVWSGLAYALGAAFYLFMPFSSMTNPPLNWGYPRTWLGFMHAFSRGQYAQTNPTTSFGKFIDQIFMYWEGAFDEFNASFLLLVVLPFAFLFRMRNRERGWMVGTLATYLCLAVLLMVLLNPENDKHGKDMTRVFFAASHVMLAMWLGFGITLFGAAIARRYEQVRVILGLGLVLGAALALVDWSSELADTQFYLNHWTRGFAFGLLVFLGALFLVHRSNPTLGIVKSPPIGVVLLSLSLLPIWSILAHWGKNEQHDHQFGYWYGHDMFTPPFEESDGRPIYPEMSENAILFGGTDPGRFNPTYMIFAESFIPSGKKPKDPDFDRRDVALITQNALADSTYLDTVRAHYQRSKQIDWNPQDPSYIPFASGAKNKLLGTNFLSGFSGAIDRWMISMGASWELDRRTSDSYFEPEDILKPAELLNRFNMQSSAPVKLVASILPQGTVEAAKGASNDDIRSIFSEGFNALINGDPLWNHISFKGVEFSDTTILLQKQVASLGNTEPKKVEQNGLYVRWKQARIRLNRRVLDELFSGLILPGKAGLYPDLELNAPSQIEAEMAFAQYVQEAEIRMKAGALKPGEIVQNRNGRIQVAGQVSVMEINAKLAKILFDKNPDRDFFIEVSYPLEWMYPHLTPFGIILKLNREEVPEITDEMMRKDRLFWAQYQSRLTGDWVTDETSIAEIGQWSVKTYKRWDLDGYNGSPAFVRDEAAQKSFSKLRTSIADMYRWRISNYKLAITKEKDPVKKNDLMLKEKRMTKEYIFALKQAWAFCPYSPEVVSHLAQLILQLGYEKFEKGDKVAATLRRDELFHLIYTYEQFDPGSPILNRLLGGLLQYMSATKLFDVNDSFLKQILSDSPALLNLLEVMSRNLQEVMNKGQSASLTPSATLQRNSLNLSDQEIQKIQQQLIVLKQRHQVDPNDPKVTLELASIYIRLKQNVQAMKLVDSLVQQPNLEIGIRFTVASIYNALGQSVKANEQNGIAVAALRELEADVEKEPSKFDLALRLATVQVQLGQNQKGVNVLLNLIERFEVNITNLLMTAEFFNQLGDSKSLEIALAKLTQMMPESPESWYDLAGVQASNGSSIKEAWMTLAKALTLDKRRRSNDAAADNLYERVKGDPRFADIRLLPEFKSWQP
ncbi:MAG: hypothetical protein CMO44_00180 [Verrucomicrobiales bacterium]|nr:hypothetical protein [Verrucomicrobiales bacterium]